RRGTTLRIDVIDTGIGIAVAQHALIFTEFTRLEAGARVATGLGLGLSIVQRLVAALGLKLELESVPGRGSRFSLLLPVATDQRQRSADRPAQATAGPPLGLRVLCVDNEPAILGGMSALLGGWGCDVRVATSLKQVMGERLLDLWVPDLVLMD